MKRVALAVASFGYVGFFPIAPGTAGSVAALPLYAIVRWVGAPAADAIAIVLVLVAGVWAAGAAEDVLGAKDPGPVVIDEVLGMLVTLAAMPLSAGGVAAGFVLFRLFDIAKPFPAGRLERLPGGAGIMLDDLAAGVYAHVGLRVLAAVVPAWVTA